MSEPVTSNNQEGLQLGMLDRASAAEFGDRCKKEFANRLVFATSVVGPGEFIENCDGKSVYFENLGIALIRDDLKGALEPYFRFFESERTRRLPTPPIGLPVTITNPSPCLVDTDESTWGLQATAHTNSKRNGKGIKVAILDSGLDFKHEAFRGRAATYVSRSFVAKPANVDELGHGTACASILCGQPVLASGQRIGVAPAVDLVVAKIFDKNMKSPDVRTLAAIDWAIGEKCSIISMSIGDPLDTDAAPSKVFEEAAKAALAKGILLIAGAGNDSRRSDQVFEPVNHPANCESIMAVGALDRCLNVAEVSNRSLRKSGGEINLAAPGRSIRVANADAMERYVLKHGTSFAVPFVAGIAALWMQADKTKKLKGQSLWKKLVATARPLSQVTPLDPDVGAGIPQAPQ